VTKTSLLAFACTLAAGIAQAQTFSVLHTFQYFPHGASPYAPLYRDSQRNLYGTTNGGGQYNSGVVFKIDTAGRQTVLHTFSGLTGGLTDGACPTGGVVMDAAGNLYGTAFLSMWEQGPGLVYKIDTSGQFTVLYTFKGGADGSGPASGLILDSAGNLYGTTFYGGVNNNGVVFKVSPLGQETVLHSFTGAPDGASPWAGLTADAAGNLYGTTYSGGAYSAGTVFKVTPSGQERVLFSFAQGSSGAYPAAGVVLDADGNIYGAAGVLVYKLDQAEHFTTLAHLEARACGLARDASGNFYVTSVENDPGKLPYGAVFKLDTSGTVSLLYKFKGAALLSGIELPVDGYLGQNAGPIVDSAGNVYGTTPFAGTAGIVYEIQASGKVRTLYSFEPAAGGTAPNSYVTLDAGASLYGTTAYGGSPANVGVLYKLSAGGKETVLHAFLGGSTDGAFPSGHVVLDSAGNLYGTTSSGGASNYGMVYKLTPSGQESILHMFTGGADGREPFGLAIDSAGNLYGTTFYGGAVGQTGWGQGVVFKLDAAGDFSLLYSFTGLSDGGYPGSGVAVDTAGNLYGTAEGGVTGSGVVFKIDSTGAYSVLHTFSGTTDGGNPVAGVTLGPAGGLYGTCAYGGLGGGTLFKLDATGKLRVMYAFPGESILSYPYAGVAVDKAGNVFGTLSHGWESIHCPGSPGGCGEVYEVDSSGQFTVLYDFPGGPYGSAPYGGSSPIGVALDGAGHLYGATAGLDPYVYAGGVGTVYRITLP
jgi:uncharacterized repeat protein (TIGR03803 family)